MTDNTTPDELVEALGRLRDNLSSAPPEADRCFVSLDDHRAILAAHRTAAQPEREAVLVTDEMVEAALKARVPGGSKVLAWLPPAADWTPHQTARSVMRCALEAALTTPAPAVSTDPLALAILFHDTYEQLAPQFGYETRPDTKQFDPDTPNGRLMTAVCAAILTRLRGEGE